MPTVLEYIAPETLFHFVEPAAQQQFLRSRGYAKSDSDYVSPDTFSTAAELYQWAEEHRDDERTRRTEEIRRELNAAAAPPPAPTSPEDKMAAAIVRALGKEPQPSAVEQAQRTIQRQQESYLFDRRAELSSQTRAEASAPPRTTSRQHTSGVYRQVASGAHQRSRAHEKTSERCGFCGAPAFCSSWPARGIYQPCCEPCARSHAH